MAVESTEADDHLPHRFAGRPCVRPPLVAVVERCPVSAYPYPAPAPAPAPFAAAATTDPTAVMGRRIAAWILDLVIFLLLSSFFGPTPLSPFAQYVKVPENMTGNHACEVLRNNDRAVACTTIGDRVYFTDKGDA